MLASKSEKMWKKLVKKITAKYFRFLEFIQNNVKLGGDNNQIHLVAFIECICKPWLLIFFDITYFFFIKQSIYLHSKKSREIIKQICNKHRLQKQICSIMKQNCFISNGMKQFWFMMEGICFWSWCFCFDFLQCIYHR